LECAVNKGHVAVRRNDVGAVRQNLHAVFNFKDLHAGVTPDKVGKDAFMIRRQMLHQNKSHAGTSGELTETVGVGGHAGEKSFKGRQPTGGCADADNREIGRDFLFCLWHFDLLFHRGFFFRFCAG